MFVCDSDFDFLKKLNSWLFNFMWCFCNMYLVFLHTKIALDKFFSFLFIFF
jgi:hypothetical protein